MFSLNTCLLPLNCLNLLSQAISNCELILEKGRVFNIRFGVSSRLPFEFQTL